MNQVHDVVVVGGGVTGCAVAYELAKRSLRVLLLDLAQPGKATSASAGGLWPVGEAVGLGCGVIYHATQQHNGHQADGPDALPDAFRDFLVASNARFPALAEELRDHSAVDIEYAPAAGLLFLIFEQRQWAFVERLRKVLPAATRPQLLDVDEAVRLEPNLTRDLLGGALLEGEHQVNPMLLAEAYKRAALSHGAEFRHHTRVTSLRRNGDHVTGVQLGDEFVPCHTVVNAAGAWAGQLAATIGVQLPVFPVRGQIVLTETLPPVLKCCLSASTCYMLQKSHGEVLIGSTTEKTGFDVSVTPEAIRSLSCGAVRALPLLRHARIKRTWAGLRPGTPDELPFLGPVNGLRGYINAAGGFRTGIVASPLTGLVVAQVIAGEEPAFPVEPFLLERLATSPSVPQHV